MHDDDTGRGRLYSRREALALLGAGAMTMLAGKGSARAAADAPRAASCIARPALTEGPFFVDEKLNRSDVRPDPKSGDLPQGVLLRLGFRVSQLGGGACAPLPNAQVDVWQCDAAGRYSDVQNPSDSTVGQRFLRGYQLTDSNGAADFVTIYPGCYSGRTAHIHFKIRTSSTAGKSEFTSQLFFDDAISDQIFAQPPYARASGNRTRNARDGIFRHGGEQLLLRPTKDGVTYAAAFDIALAAPV